MLGAVYAVAFRDPEVPKLLYVAGKIEILRKLRNFRIRCYIPIQKTAQPGRTGRIVDFRESRQTKST